MPVNDTFIAPLRFPSNALPRRHLAADFKAQAILLAESIGRAKAARQLDMSVKTLGHWLDASRTSRPLISLSRKPVSELESELARLWTRNVDSAGAHRDDSEIVPRDRLPDHKGSEKLSF